MTNNNNKTSLRVNSPSPFVLTCKLYCMLPFDRSTGRRNTVLCYFILFKPRILNFHLTLRSRSN